MNTTITGRKKQSSKITVPNRAHPFAKLIFSEMKKQNISYDELEWMSGVLRSTFKSYRTDNTPGLQTIEAALGALGYTLVPVPKISTLPPSVVEQLLEVGQHFVSDEACFGAALLATATWPAWAKERQSVYTKLAPNSLPAQRRAAEAAADTLVRVRLTQPIFKMASVLVRTGCATIEEATCLSPRYLSRLTDCDRDAIHQAMGQAPKEPVNA